MRRVKSNQGRFLRFSFATLALTIAAHAAAQIASPPQLPHLVTVFPERDFVAIEGYAPNADVTVTVFRSGRPVADAVGRTDATGLLEVNHPGGVCWRARTPDILPGDVVRVTYSDTPENILLGVTPGSGDEATTLNVNATQAVIEGLDVVIRGTAQTAAGAPIDLSLIEARIVQPKFRDTVGSRITKRDIRADSTGGRVAGVPGTSVSFGYDAPGSINWTARFTGLNATEQRLAVEGQTRVLSWMAVTPDGDRLGITIYEVGEAGGPGFGGCPAGPTPMALPTAPDAPVPYDPVWLLDAANPATDLTQLHANIVFSERDFVAVDGYAPGVNIQVVVRRPGLGIIGSARGTTDSAGLLEVNHPGGVCWTGQTPDIRPGDLVDVFVYSDPDLFTAGDETFMSGETQAAIHDAVTRSAFVDAAGNVVVLGSAQNPDGSPFTDAQLANMEQRIVAPDLTTTRVGRRDIRAVVGGAPLGGVPGGVGTLVRDPANPLNWIATYVGLDDVEKQIAVNGQSRALSWFQTNAAGDRFGITIFEFGEVGGPGFGGCPQRGENFLPSR